ncbi:TPA: hypothetical protein ACPJ21_003745 [Vibrio alginolyticus]|uniref:hypothetical protein n=1 Tax=Vibrio alginolyticus TaxID=663 RepID=UPI001EED03C8|nr:hypothetical protein [Vibrio alginolyticus]
MIPSKAVLPISKHLKKSDWAKSKLSAPPRRCTSRESNHHVYYQRFRISLGKNSDISSDALYAAISNKLSDWIFIYIAKGKIHFGKETIIAPYLLESGKPHLFIVAEEKEGET